MEKSRLNTGGMLISGLLVSFLIILIVLFGAGYVGAKKLSTNKGTLLVAKIVRLPIARVNSEKILFSDYIDDVATLKRFYDQVEELAGNVTDAELGTQALSRLIANIVIENTADELNISVGDDDITNMKSELFSQFNSEEEAKKDLESKYGWSLEKYTKKVIIPIILEKKLSDAFQDSENEEYTKYGNEEQIRARHILFTIDEGQQDHEVYNLAKEVLKEIKDGGDFATLAGKYGTDGTSSVGGDLGWFGEGVMIPEFEDAVFSLAVDELYGEPLKTKFGYHIIEKTGERSLRDFDAFLTEKLENSEIEVYSGLSNPFEKKAETQL